MPSIEHAEIRERLAAWLERASVDAPADIIAFSINLYDEPFAAELVGSTYYEENDPDWACEEAFEPKERRFELPKSAFGATWEEGLDYICGVVRAYLAESGRGARLKKATAITVGFVDGDLVRVWP